MPLYEYKCHRCNETFEVRQKFSDEPLTVHEKCGGELEKLISVSALQFKGTGWYVTDYGKGGSVRPGNGSSGKSDSNGDSKSESKSEAGKSDSKSSDSSKSESKPKTESKPAAPVT